MKSVNLNVLAAALCTCVLLTGCTMAPKEPIDEVEYQREDETVCDEACADTDVNRYRYYLGILSVFVFG